MDGTGGDDEIGVSATPVSVKGVPPLFGSWHIRGVEYDTIAFGVWEYEPPELTHTLNFLFFCFKSTDRFHTAAGATATNASVLTNGCIRSNLTPR
jgi:hypothetical protein